MLTYQKKSNGEKAKIAVFVSGGGTNLQAILDSDIQSGEVALVVASNDNAYALQRAKDNNIKSVVISKKLLQDNFISTLIATLEEHKIDLIVLAGYLTILPKEFTDKYEYKIINVHPSLIPSFCGDGYYGLKVHDAVLESGVKVTGATAHFVNDKADDGAIILQKAVDVMHNDSSETLQKRVMENAEWIILPRAIDLYCQGKIKIDNDKAYIID